MSRMIKSKIVPGRAAESTSGSATHVWNSLYKPLPATCKLQKYLHGAKVLACGYPIRINIEMRMIYHQPQAFAVKLGLFANGLRLGIARRIRCIANGIARRVLLLKRSDCDKFKALLEQRPLLWRAGDTLLL